MANLEENVSVCPRGEVFELPAEADYEREFERLKAMVQAQRDQAAALRSHGQTRLDRSRRTADSDHEDVARLRALGPLPA